MPSRRSPDLQPSTRHVTIDDPEELEDPDGPADAAATHDHPTLTEDGDPDLLLGRYRLGRRLGAGGFATVHAAHDERLDRAVAVKVLARERIHDSRFDREARAAARLSHPGIVTLFEAARDDDGAYLVTELVKGTTLDRALAAGELSDRDILAVATTLVGALEHAHGQDVVHRDVKPQNILIPARRHAGAPAAKLTDFGIARVIGGDTLTRTGDVLGTLAYMSPEQAEGRPTGPESDLYSLALVIYEALTGVNPVADLLRRGHRRRLGTYLPPVRRQRADLPRHLGAAIDQALRPRAGERGTLADLGRAIETAAPLVDDRAGVVAPARTLTLGRTQGDRTDPTRRARPVAAGAPRPARPATARTDATRAATRRSAPVAGPTAGRRTTPAGLAPNGLLLVGLGLGAPALALIGLAVAWPALVALTIRTAVRRAALAGLGFGWLLAAPAVTGHVLLLDPAHRPLVPLAVIAGAWALGAAVAPVLIRHRRPLLDLVAGSVIAAGIGLAPPLAHVHGVRDGLAGALIGWLLLVHRALPRLVRDTVAQCAS